MIVAAGIDAATVNSIFNPRYSFAAAIRIAIANPSTTPFNVISGKLFDEGTTSSRRGRWVAILR